MTEDRLDYRPHLVPRAHVQVLESAQGGLGRRDRDEVAPELPDEEGGVRGMLETDSSRAIEAGLSFRPIAETARDTLEWDRARGDYEPAAGMAPEREAELLEEWRSRG